MIEIDKLLGAVRKRTVVWTFHDIYATALEAKQVAARLFVKANGAVVRKTGPKTWLVLSWKVEESL